MFAAFIHGFILAFSLIIPLGIQNIFIFTQGATQSRFFKALPPIIVASLCDTTLILLAVLGVSVTILTIQWIRFGLICAGVLFLIIMGWLTWRNATSKTGPGAEMADWPVSRQISFTLSVSLLNPHAILDTIGVIGLSSISYTGESKITFTLACISVSWVWFFGLAFVGRLLGALYPLDKFHKIMNRTSAVIIWLCAIYLLISLK